MPGKKSTRRSISVKGVTYQRLRNYCDRNGVTCSGQLEELIHRYMDAVGEPMPTRVEKTAQEKLRDPDADGVIGAGIFTF